MNEMLEWLILMVFQLIIFGVTVCGNLGCVKWWWPFHQVCFRRALNFGNGQLQVFKTLSLPGGLRTGKALFDNGSTKNNFQWGWPPMLGAPSAARSSLRTRSLLMQEHVDLPHPRGRKAFEDSSLHSPRSNQKKVAPLFITKKVKMDIQQRSLRGESGEVSHPNI